MRPRQIIRILICSAAVWACVVWTGAGWQPQATAQATQGTTTTVHGRVEVTGAEPAGKTRHGEIPVTVVWLTPMTGAGGEITGAASAPLAALTQNLQLIQKNKSFEPHNLVVPAGAVVEFPNHDPFFHNVFSLFEGKRFDCGSKIGYLEATIAYALKHPELAVEFKQCLEGYA